ncbi:MAG TPA: hypothetical protein VN256_26025 [Pyrinomonadaceae bacterium]|nr:hypothetical protein [Pyrinomonadaceae bacterium]
MKPGFLSRVKLEASFWLGRRLPTCEEVLPVLSQSLERKLTLRERVTLRLHFLICVYCLRYLKQLRLMRASVRARSEQIETGDSAPAPALPEDARERLKRALERAKQ